MARGVPDKPALTPRERIQVAFAHLVLGIDQHDLAATFGVNSGRVAEAVNAVRQAVDWPESDV